MGPNNCHFLVFLRMCPCRRCPRQGDMWSAVDTEGTLERTPAGGQCRPASRGCLSSQSPSVCCDTCWCCCWSPGTRTPGVIQVLASSLLAFCSRVRGRHSRTGKEAVGGWGHLGCPVTSVLGVAWGHLSCQPSCRPSCLVQMRFPDRWTSPHTFLSWSPILRPTARNPASRAR